MSRWAEFGFPNPNGLPLYIPLTGIRLALNERHFELHDDVVYSKKPYTEKQVRINTLRDLVNNSGTLRFPLLDYLDSQLYNYSCLFFNELVEVGFYAFTLWACLNNFEVDFETNPKPSDEEVMHLFLDSIGLGKYFFNKKQVINFRKLSILNSLNIMYYIINKCPNICQSSYYLNFDFAKNAKYYEYSIDNHGYFSATKPEMYDRGTCRLYYDVSDKLEFFDDTPVLLDEDKTAIQCVGDYDNRINDGINQRWEKGWQHENEL